MRTDDRVRLHPATDAWMMGDRYGTVTKVLRNGRIRVLLDKSQRTRTFDPELVEVID